MYPPFTVLMAVYSGDKSNQFISAIQSIYQSSIIPDQFILVVDGPVPPDLSQVIESVTQEYSLTTFRLSENRGLSFALNYGIQYIATDFVARVDADDINHPLRFQHQLNSLVAGCDIVGSYINEFDHNGIYASRKVPISHSQIRRMIIYRNPLNHMTVFMRTSLLKGTYTYPFFPFKEDYALWILLISNGAKFHNIPFPYVMARAGKDFYNRRTGLKNAYSELMIAKLLIKELRVNPLFAFVIGFSRSAFCIIPPMLKKVLYLAFFRKTLK